MRTTTPDSPAVFLSRLAILVVFGGLSVAYGEGDGSLYDSGRTMHAGTQWTIVATYTIPEGASGLAYDGTNLYCGIYGSNGGDVYQIDPDTGSFALLFTGPQEDAFGLTYDGRDFWTTDHPGSSSNPAVAMKLNRSGDLLDQFDLPAHYMSGIAYDNGDFWVARYYPEPGTLYKVDSHGTILDEFTAPDNQPWDLCIENGNLWMADYYGDSLYKIDPSSGALLESHPSEGVDPAGVVWDGQFLWYCDNGEGFDQDYLYKVDLQGGGAPQINIPVASHDFGPVTIGDAVTWYVTVQNNGAADLIIAAVTFSPTDDLSSPDAFPVVVPPSGSEQLAIVYAPDDFAPLDATATVFSNDPIHPEEELTLTGHGVYPGPSINIVEDVHDYGPVRVNANTRWFMEIRNEGSELLTIDDILTDDPRFYLDEAFSPPISIETLSSVEVGVWYNPDSATSHSATLSVYSNDPSQNPAVVSCSGSGACPEYATGQELWSYLIDTGYDNTPQAIASIPDISGDGIADVIVCSEDDFVRCFNGGADGIGDVLWEHQIYAGSIFSQSALQITDDINGDGYHDVVVGAAWGACLVRAVSGKTGETIWTHDTHEYGDGGWVYQVHCQYDYNGDGVPDVLAATGDDANDTGPKRAYCLDGLTGGSIWETPLSGPGFAVLGVEDFTGDGQPDAVAGASNEDETLGWAFGIDGANGSVEWTFPVSGTSVWALQQIGDITSDGISDVIVGDFSGIVYGLDATNGNQRYLRSGYGTIVRFERLDDVNGDGHPDVTPAHFGTTARVINGQTGDPVWSTPLADKPASVGRIADITGDGINDLLIGTLFTNNFVYFLDGVDGSILEFVDYGTPVDSIAAVPDVVGDGNWEAVAGGRNGLLTCLAGSRGNPCDIPAPIPTVSEWGLIVMVVMLLSAGALVLTRRQRQLTAGS